VSASDYCSKCNGVILKPNVNYGINPDVVCKCPQRLPWDGKWDNPFPENPTMATFHAFVDREIAMCHNLIVDLNRVRSRVADHIRSAPEREAAQLKKWAIGYDDGIRTALAVLKREDE